MNGARRLALAASPLICRWRIVPCVEIPLNFNSTFANIDHQVVKVLWSASTVDRLVALLLAATLCSSVAPPQSCTSREVGGVGGRGMGMTKRALLARGVILGYRSQMGHNALLGFS